MTNSSRFRLAILVVVLLLPLVVSAQPFAIGHYVIAGGGGSNSTGSSGGQTFRVDGTIGQNLAGTTSTGPNGSGGQFSLRGGFWAFQPAAPTAATASISGRVSTANGFGIRSVVLVLTNTATGESYNALSSSFGHYRFDGIEVGQTYVLTARTNRYAFEPNTRTITLTDELTDENFIAVPQKMK